MTSEADLAIALRELKLALELFQSNPKSIENGLAVVRALERYSPNPGSPFYSHFVAARDDLIREMMDLFPDSFPSSRVAH